MQKTYLSPLRVCERKQIGRRDDKTGSIVGSRFLNAIEAIVRRTSPRPTTTTFVPLPAGAATAPTPSVLWVKVSADGRTEDARRLRPSNDPAFERAVHQYVRTLAWQPAKKDGAAIAAWTQWIFPPAPR